MVRRVVPAVALTLLGVVVGLATGVQVAHAPTPVFINEIHYDNAGIDTGEAGRVAHRPLQRVHPYGCGRVHDRGVQ